jgi:hypothetical protein
MPFIAHWNWETPPQLLSAVAIDPVASWMMATFHLFAAPCMDAVAVAEIGMELKPSTLMK